MINIKLLAYPGAPDSLFSDGKEKIKNYFPNMAIEYNSPDPDVLVFLSGGSENEATQIIHHKKYNPLVAFEENNSWASATEVKAWMDQYNIPGMLIDLYDKQDRSIIQLFVKTRDNLQKLQGQTLGQIGEVSEWLVSSTIDNKLLKSKLGIQLKKIPWAEVPDYKQMEPDQNFQGKYNTLNLNAIADASRVNAALQSIIHQHHLDAITVECFSLVKNNGVTACLSLSHLNDLTIPAGCEGDITSIVGIMLVKALVGKIPWMANTIKISSNHARFAHCTAPTNMLKEFEVDTHYETGQGTAIAGKLSSDDVTIFRLNNSLNKAFIAEGTITSTHKRPNACRTQIEVSMDKQATRKLKTHPLGNHHLIITGSHYDALKMACKICGFDLV